MRRRYNRGGLAAFQTGGEVDEDEDGDASVYDPDADEADQPSGSVTASGGLAALDIPGAQEALTLMAKSSEQARQALQQAREQIMSRQYNKAQAWLAASAALGAPTRAGSTAESFGAMAGALREPLAARDAFNQQKTKDVLGIDTQLAGLDERSAQAQLSLATLRANMRAKEAALPNDKVIGADGKPYWRARPEARGQQAYVTPPAQQNVTVTADKSLYGKMADQLGEEYVNQYKTASAAPEALERIKLTRQLLKTVPYTGAGADWKLQATKGLKALGINYGGESIANTEQLFSVLGQETLSNVHASGLGTGNGFTDKDLKFLQQVVGGTVTLDTETLARLADLHENSVRQSVKKWNTSYSRLDKNLLKQLGVAPVTLPDDEAEAPAVSAPATDMQQPASANPDDDAPAGAPPQAEALLRANPTLEMKSYFKDKYGYLPDGL